MLHYAIKAIGLARGERQVYGVYTSTQRYATRILCAIVPSCRGESWSVQRAADGRAGPRSRLEVELVKTAQDQCSALRLSYEKNERKINRSILYIATIYGFLELLDHHHHILLYSIPEKKYINPIPGHNIVLGILLCFL